MLEWVAAEVLPKYARETPRKVEAAAAANIDTSLWKAPPDHM
jgi:hypothetical protein